MLMQIVPDNDFFSSIVLAWEKKLLKYYRVNNKRIYAHVMIKNLRNENIKIPYVNGFCRIGAQWLFNII